MRLVHWIFALLIAATGVSGAWAHEDVVPYELNGKIVTGGHDDVLASDNVTQRVFGYDFGEDLLDPYFIGDPGFNNGAFAIGVYPNNGLLPTPNFTLGFDVLTNLQYWDGTGGVSFGPAPADVSLGLARGSFEVFVDALGQTGTVPTIGSTGTSGRLHVHMESTLNFQGSFNPDDPNAPDGVYLVGLSLKLPGSGLANSDPIYLVYNNGLDEEIHDEAIDWVQTHLVPEPTTWMLTLTGAFVAVVSRVRKRKQRHFAPLPLAA
jgi:hypothetical protein